MEKLPATSYVRLVDIWLIFGQLYPFIQGHYSFIGINLKIKKDSIIVYCARSSYSPSLNCSMMERK